MERYSSGLMVNSNILVGDIMLILKLMDKVESGSTDDEEHMQIAELREKLGRLEVSKAQTVRAK